MRVTRLLLPLLLACASTLAAQESEETEPASDSPWRLSYFPYLSGGANDGPVISARLRYW